MYGSDENVWDSSGNSKNGSVCLSNSKRQLSSNYGNVPDNNSGGKSRSITSKVRLTSTAIFSTPVASNRIGQDTAALGDVNIASAKLFANTPSETRGTIRDVPKLSALLGFRRTSTDNSCITDDINNADTSENITLHSSSQILSNDKNVSVSSNYHSAHQVKKLYKVNNNELEDIKEHEEQVLQSSKSNGLRSLTKSVSTSKNIMGKTLSKKKSRKKLKTPQVLIEKNKQQFPK